MSDFVLGFGLPVSGVWATPENVQRLASRAEELGYGSLWTYQRLLAPAETDWGPQYRSVLDPVVALAFAAACTGNARLGTAVVNAPFLPAATLARQLVSLDVLSGGRLDVGLGLGWAREEFAALGVPFDRRGARLEDTVGALRALWADDPVEYHGEFTDVPPSRFLPKPVQRPAPPILLGATADAALRRAGRIGDGWISSSRFDLREVERAVTTVRAGRLGRRARRRRAAVRPPGRRPAGRGGPRRGRRAPDAHRPGRRRPRGPRAPARAGRDRGVPRPQLRATRRVPRRRPLRRSRPRPRRARDLRPRPLTRVRGGAADAPGSRARPPAARSGGPRGARRGGRRGPRARSDPWTSRVAGRPGTASSRARRATSTASRATTVAAAAVAPTTTGLRASCGRAARNATTLDRVVAGRSGSGRTTTSAGASSGCSSGLSGTSGWSGMPR